MGHPKIWPRKARAHTSRSDVDGVCKQASTLVKTSMTLFFIIWPFGSRTKMTFQSLSHFLKVAPGSSKAHQRTSVKYISR